MPPTSKKAQIILGPIIGGLSHERVNLWARSDKAAMLYAWVGTKKNPKLAGKKQLVEANGFSGMIAVNGLTPNKKYFFALTLNPKPDPADLTFSSFRTFPTPGLARTFHFAFGSCFLPYRDEPGLTFKHIRENQKDLAFLLMLGDQIYADAVQTNGLDHMAMSLKDYRSVYQYVWQNPHHRALLAKTPAFMILDDHEADNDWHWTDRALTQPGIGGLASFFRKLRGLPLEVQSLSPKRLRAALQANWEHQAMHAPAKSTPSGPLAYDFEYGSTAFFIMDTRTQRFFNREERQMLGDRQWAALTSWLLRIKDSHPVKFIVSSVSVLSDLIGDFTNDRWTGFKSERERLLNFIAEHEIEGVHLLVGDLHAAHSISAVLKTKQNKSIPIWEFCSSPFEQKSTWIPKLLDMLARHPVLRKQRKYYVISQINYGVVHVDFANGNGPQVRFELNYEQDGEWRKK